MNGVFTQGEVDQSMVESGQGHEKELNIVIIEFSLLLEDFPHLFLLLGYELLGGIKQLPLVH